MYKNLTPSRLGKSRRSHVLPVVIHISGVFGAKRAVNKLKKLSFEYLAR